MTSSGIFDSTRGHASCDTGAQTDTNERSLERQHSDMMHSPTTQVCLLRLTSHNDTESVQLISIVRGALKKEQLLL